MKALGLGTVPGAVEVGASIVVVGRSYLVLATGIQHSAAAAAVAVLDSRVAAQWGMAAQNLPVEAVLHHLQLDERPEACTGSFTSRCGVT